MQRLFAPFKTLAKGSSVRILIPASRPRFYYSEINQAKWDINELLSGVGESSEPITEEPHTTKQQDDDLKTLQRAISQNYSLGKYKTAESDSLQYIKQIKEIYGANHPATLSGLNNLALILKTTGDYQTAKGIYAKILSAYIEVFGSKQNSSINVMQNLANLHRDSQEHDNAVQLYNDVLALRKEVNPDDKISIAVCLFSMAGPYRELRQYAKAEEVLEESLQILLENVGEDHLHTAVCLNNMGLNYKKQKKYERAEQCYLRIREKLLRKDHPDLIAINHNIGELYLAMGNEDKAAEHMAEALMSIQSSEKSN